MGEKQKKKKGGNRLTLDLHSTSQNGTSSAQEMTRLQIYCSRNHAGRGICI